MKFDKFLKLYNIMAHRKEVKKFKVLNLNTNHLTVLKKNEFLMLAVFIKVN